mgnify:CR=1 FL=1
MPCPVIRDLPVFADPLWAQQCLAYHVQAQPDAATIVRLAAAQQYLGAAIPMALHLIPARALHCSVVTIISPDGPMIDKAPAWQKIRDAMSDDLVARIRLAEPTSIMFDEIRVTPAAIIAVTTEQPSLFRELREIFSELLDDLGLPARRYTQTHVTLARFTQDGHIDRPALLRLRDAEPIVAQFSALRLVAERQYPSLELEEI